MLKIFKCANLGVSDLVRLVNGLLHCRGLSLYLHFNMVTLEANFYTVLGVIANHISRGVQVQVEIVGYHPLFVTPITSVLPFFRFLFFFANHLSACLTAHRLGYVASVSHM